MPDTFNVTTDLKLIWNYVKDFLGVEQEAADTLTYTLQLTYGAANYQANLLYQLKQFPIAAGATHTYQLTSNSISGFFGLKANFTKMKLMLFINTGPSHTPANLVDPIHIGGHATQAFRNWVADPTDKVIVKPGGVFLITDPLAGFGITATTQDKLNVNNPGSSETEYAMLLAGLL